MLIASFILVIVELSAIDIGFQVKPEWMNTKLPGMHTVLYTPGYSDYKTPMIYISKKDYQAEQAKAMKFVNYATY